MGIKGLLGSLKPYVERVHVSKYANQRVSFLRLKFADILSFFKTHICKFPRYNLGCRLRVKQTLLDSTARILQTSQSYNEMQHRSGTSWRADPICGKVSPKMQYCCAIGGSSVFNLQVVAHFLLFSFEPICAEILETSDH